MGGRGSARGTRTFARKSDALAFDADVKRRKALGDLSSLVARDQSLDELARDWYELYAAPNLADNTLGKYRRVLRLYILPELGQLKLAEVTPEVVARFRTDLERRGRRAGQRSRLARGRSGDVPSWRRVGQGFGEPGAASRQAVGQAPAGRAALLARSG